MDSTEKKDEVSSTEKTEEKKEEEKKEEEKKEEEKKEEEKKEEEKKEEEKKEEEKKDEEKKEEEKKEEEKEEEEKKDEEKKDEEKKEEEISKDVPKKEKEEFELESDLKITAEWFYQKIQREGEIEIIEEEENPNEEELVDILFKNPTEKELILHWGVFKSLFTSGWFHPPKDNYPLNTKEFDKNALQTKFEKKENEKEQTIHIIIPRGQGYSNAIGGLNFVFFDPKNNKWYNNYRKDYQIKFKLKINRKKSKQILVETGLYVPEFVADVINCEANYGSWTLMHRYNKCFDIITKFDENTESEKWMWILIWLRYSYQRQLDWQRNYNTRPSLLSGAMNRLSNEVTLKYALIFQKEKLYRNLYYSQASLIKSILSQLGKGTGDGQRIRDEILHIMHRNGIPETPGNNFYEQWHQKLHNNTTPDDIVICEALLNFLYSGNIEDYRKTLKAGGISKERLASYERKIIDEPWHNRNYIHDFQNYLQILKTVHASNDLIMMYDGCKYIFGNNGKLDDIIRNKDDHDILRQIWRVAEGRDVLQNIIRQNMRDSGKLRDLLFFEVALEVYVRQLVEKVIHIKIPYEQYIDEISLVLRNIKVSYPNFSEFTLCYNDWKNIVEKLKHDHSKDAALKVKSVVSRLNRLLAGVIDYYNKYFDSRARYFGKECGVDNYYSNMFAEEMIRGSIFFALSMLLKKIEPTIRNDAKLGDWLIISRGKEDSVSGNLIHVPNLHEVQLTKYPEKTIILSENVSGNEEIPENCVCLIIIKSENYPDILAHVSVRARNLNVPFAVCFNENKANDMLKLINNQTIVKLQNQEVILEKTEKKEDENKEENGNEEVKKVQVVKTGDKYEKIYLELEEFNKNSVGAKSNNTQKIFSKVPDCDWLKYPESFAIPFNVHEYFLSLTENNEIAEEIKEYTEKIKLAIKKRDITTLLEKCKECTLKIQFVENDETKKLKDRLLKFGVKESEFDAAFKAIKTVWASKYNERAYIATSKVGITLDDIRMAVLCQKIIPAEYAYVIHTKNPSTNNENELFAEIVSGMGETLVGAYEGQSFSFAYNKTNGSYDIQSYPNKSISLRNSGYIFRSDSNTEDLEGFSGAGLFDSVPMVNDNEVEMAYYSDKLFNDKGFVDNAIKKVSSLGIGVEKLYGFPQDIEGVYYNGDFYIVQTRPQV